MGKPLHVLIVEDSEDDALLLVRELRRGGYKPTFERVDTAAAMTAALVQQKWDVIISDYALPHFSGLAALELLKESGLDLPFIIVSGAIGEEIAVEAMKAGAHDYVMKDNLTRLIPAIERELRDAAVRRERKQTEQALQESEERLRSVIDHAPVILWATDRDGLFTFSEGRGLAAMEVHLGRLLGRSIFELFADNPQIISDTRRTLAGEAFSSKTEVGDIAYEIKYAPILDRENGVVGMIGVAIDVTDRQQVEQERIRLATAIEQAAEDIILTDTNGTIQYVNPAFERITGYSRAEAIGRNPRFLKSGKHNARFYQEMWQTIQSGHIWTGRLTNRRKDGTLIEEEATISPIHDANGQIIGYVSVKRDVTEQVKLEAQLRQAQKMEAVGQLAGGVAHDFNNILQAILGYTDMVKSSLPPDDPAQADLGQVIKSTNRATSLVRQLMIFSRQETLQPQNLDLNDIITNLLKMLQRIIGEHIDLDVHFQSGIKFIYADPGQVEQILMNLCINARDAMPDGGKIAIETENVFFDSHHAKSYPWAKEGEYVLLSVSDTGIGIPPDIKDRIFEPFFTTKEVGEGTGLGLATVYAIIKQHDGLIDVYSEPGQGTTFRIYLPACRRREEPRLEKIMEASVPGGTETILLAEDDDSVRDLVVQVLEQAGYSVLVAHNGDEALQLFEQQAEAIDLVLLDAVMPKRSGRAVYDVIKTNRPFIPVLFTTGYSYEILKTGHLPEGVQLLRKPYSPVELLGKVREMLEARA